MNCELVKPNEPDPKDNKRTWGRTDRKTAIGTKQTFDSSRNIYWDRRCA